MKQRHDVRGFSDGLRNKRKPSRDVPAHSKPPAGKNPVTVDIPLKAVPEHLIPKSIVDKNVIDINNSSKSFHHSYSIASLLNSEDCSSCCSPAHQSYPPPTYLSLTCLPKEKRPPQPLQEREHYEQLWAQNFERSEVRYQKPSVVRSRASVGDSSSLYIPIGHQGKLLEISGYSLARDDSGKLYTVFRLEMDCLITNKRWTVYRRYADFRRLNDTLKSQGYRVPLLPPKRILRSFGTYFLQRRQADLQKWLLDLMGQSSSVNIGNCFAADVHDSDALRFFLTNMPNTPPPLEVTCSKFDGSGSVPRMDLQEELIRNEEMESQGSLELYPVNKVGLNDFDLLRVIGKGSFGKVVLVRKKDSGELYAMKVLFKETVVEKRQVEHTRTERRVLGSINHPFIVCLHYAFQTSSRLFFVLDFCPGGDIFFHLSRFGSFCEDITRMYAAEIALALFHLHRFGVVYRDLKPENILLDREGHIRLADFGLAKEGITNHVLGANTMCGTPEYLPPEILNRSGHGTAVDWWNLGMVIYEMLTGHPPWYTTDRMKLFIRLRKADLEFPAGMSNEAMSLISGLLNRNPLERLGSRSNEEILRHPFFAGIDWESLLRKEVAPLFLPCCDSDPQDTSNFETTFTDIPIRDTLESEEEDDDDQEIHAQQMLESEGRGSVIRELSYTFQGFTFDESSHYN